MKINSKKRFLTSVIATTLAAATIALGTAFYIQGSAAGDSNPIQLELKETQSSYSIVPGIEAKKDPTVTVTTSVKTFVFVEVKEENTEGVVAYSIDGKWKKLEGLFKNNDGDSIDVYYCIVDKNETIPVLSNDKVRYYSTITNSDMLELKNENKDVTLTFSAKAIEADVFNGKGDTEDDQAEYAYEHFDDQDVSYTVDSQNSWSSVVNKAKNATTSEVVINVKIDKTINDSINFGDIPKDLHILGGDKSVSSSESISQFNFAGSGNRTIVIDNLKLQNGFVGFQSGLKIISMNEANSNLVLNNVTIERKSWTDSSLYEKRYGLHVSGKNSTVTLSGKTSISVEKGSGLFTTTETAIYVGSQSKVIIDEDMTGTISGKINVQNGGTLVIKGGTFEYSGLKYSEFKKYVDTDNYTIKAYNSSGTPVSSPKDNEAYYKYVVTKK